MKRLIVILFVCLWMTTSCAPAARPDNGYNESLYREPEGAMEYVRDDRRFRGAQFDMIGYSRQTGNEMYNATDGGAVPGPDVYIDRNVLARHIAFLTTKLPQIDDAAVLVTDDQVLIGVTGREGKPDEDTLYEAKRTALSLTPRYFKIHVTGDPEARSQIMNIGSQAGTARATLNGQEMEELLERMGADTPLDQRFEREDEPFSQGKRPMTHKRMTPSAGELSH
ncbi:YhcN/YlaJ family sporulation lipoprotein [Desmospora profundinema]|nr:YhcN/YlaJ family sporulation lipoprotein [Desmospora profundinema]